MYLYLLFYQSFVIVAKHVVRLEPRWKWHALYVFR